MLMLQSPLSTKLISVPKPTGPEFVLLQKLLCVTAMMGFSHLSYLSARTHEGICLLLRLFLMDIISPDFPQFDGPAFDMGRFFPFTDPGSSTRPV